MSAGVLILSLPVTVLFLVFQRDFVKGLASGALKGQGFPEVITASVSC